MSSGCASRPPADAWRTPRSRSRPSPRPAASALRRRCAARFCARSRSLPRSTAAVSTAVRFTRSTRPPPERRSPPPNAIEGDHMDIAILIFDRLAALDAIGPYEVLSRLPGATVTFVAEQAGEKRTDPGPLALVADATLTELEHPEIVLVPGGPGQVALM